MQKNLRTIPKVPKLIFFRDEAYTRHQAIQLVKRLEE